MDYLALQEEIRKYVIAYFDDSKKELLYHNITHTERVVKAAKLIAGQFQLGDQELFIVITAAWFHDIGYCKNGKDDHEEESAFIALKHLKGLAIDNHLIDNIISCIKATKVPQSPTNLLEKILCDADLYHLGTDDFPELNNLIRKELSYLEHQPISKKEWRKCTIEFLKNHNYHTDYCRQMLNDKKQQNLNNLIENREPQIKKTEFQANPYKETKALDKGNKETARGIETLFRITSTNNQRLSDMADNKANILITVNSIIMSVIISLLLRKLENSAYLIFPTFLILGTSALTMVISILATRPSIPSGVFTKEDVDMKRVNLLFFGNFYKTSLEDYSKGMWKVMEDRSFLYGTLIKDVYSQGVVLGRKYKLLRLAYNIFMYGIIGSVISFAFSIYFM